MPKKKYRQSKEHKTKIGNANLGKVRTKLTRKKISENNCRYWKGKKHTKEQKQKISKTLFGHSVSKKTRDAISRSHFTRYGKIQARKIIESAKLTIALKRDPIFIGLMLSDGSIVKRKDSRNCGFYLTQKESHKQLVNETSQLLEEYQINNTITKYYRERNHTFEHILYTKNHVSFTELRNYWYPDGKKIVPIDMILNAEALAFWFMGDGTSWYVGKNKNRVIIKLCTQGFDKKYVNRLYLGLRQLGLDHIKIYPAGKGFDIQIAKSSEVTKFMNLINPYILSDFSYKVKYPKLEVIRN